MGNAYNRRKFLQTATLGAAGIGVLVNAKAGTQNHLPVPDGGRIGIIGLDTSHSIAFTEALNAATPNAIFEGYKIVAAYPWGSRDIKSSTERIPSYTEQVKKMGVEIVDSIAALLQKVDVVMLETNDGRPHLQQALEVMKSGKRLFIDKPVAASLKEVLTVYEAAQHFKVPVFSSSSLRYNEFMQDTAAGKTVGKILGADTFSPATLEKTQADFFWYGIHGIEMLCTLMGKGCASVMRINTPDTDIVVGKWSDGRLGTFRGTRSGKSGYGGTAFGENGVQRIGPYSGYNALLAEIIQFFKTGISPVSSDETIEIYAFMEAAHESGRRGGKPVAPQEVLTKAKKLVKRNWQQYK
ncbi:MAG: Gfo/Idh/MocA family oxidoreductase [Chitinophagaceae bacterium]|nr:Gfo/Idh/MocA family oxidoreductase [Chitinophagaceae bacterium]